VVCLPYVSTFLSWWEKGKRQVAVLFLQHLEQQPANYVHTSLFFEEFFGAFCLLAGISTVFVRWLPLVKKTVCPIYTINFVALVGFLMARSIQRRYRKECFLIEWCHRPIKSIKKPFFFRAITHHPSLRPKYSTHYLLISKGQQRKPTSLLKSLETKVDHHFIPFSSDLLEIILLCLPLTK
jgi:hypothetical protein